MENYILTRSWPWAARLTNTPNVVLPTSKWPSLTLMIPRAYKHIGLPKENLFASADDFYPFERAKCQTLYIRRTNSPSLLHHALALAYETPDLHVHYLKEL